MQKYKIIFFPPKIWDILQGNVTSGGKNAINVMNDSTFSASVFFFRNILLPLSAV
jgi:hypothetical protein